MITLGRSCRYLAAVVVIVTGAVGAAKLASGGSKHPAVQTCPALGGYCSIPPKRCSAEGNRDLNPTDRAIAPKAGKALIPRGPDGPQIGFNDAAVGAGQVSARQDAGLARRAGATLLRFPLEWAKIEPEPGVLNLGLTDREYCAERAAGIRPVFELATTPRWAADPGIPCTDPCLSPPAPQHDEDLRRFAELIAGRYPQAAAVEVWNEPNLHQFFTSPNPARYVEVLRDVYTGVKDGDPQLPVLGGALSNQQTDDPATGNLAATSFLNGMYDAGAAAYMDGVSVHPYPIYPLNDPRELFDQTLIQIRSVIAARSPDTQPHLWITEVGVSTSPYAGSLSTRFSPNAAAATLLAIYGRVALSPDVDAVLFHTLIEPGPGVASPPGVGWLVPVGVDRFMPAPVYCNFAAVFARPISCDRALRATPH